MFSNSIHTYTGLLNVVDMLCVRIRTRTTGVCGYPTNPYRNIGISVFLAEEIAKYYD